MSNDKYQDSISHIDQAKANEVLENDRKLELIKCKDIEISTLKTKLTKYIAKVKEKRRILNNDNASKDKLISNLKLELEKKTHDCVVNSKRHFDQIEKLKEQHLKELGEAKAFTQNKLEQLKSQNDRIEKIVDRRVMQMKSIVSVSKLIRSESRNLQQFNQLQTEEINELKLTQQLTQTTSIQSKDKATDCYDLNQEYSSREESSEDLRLELKAKLCAEEKLNKIEAENDELKNLVSCNKSLINSLRAYCKKYREKSENLDKENKLKTDLLNIRTNKQDQVDKSTDCSDLKQETLFICHDLEHLKKAKDLAEEKLFKCEMRNAELQKEVDSKINLAKNLKALAIQFRTKCDNLKKENELKVDESVKLKSKEELQYQERIQEDKSTDCVDLEEASVRCNYLFQEKLSIEEKLNGYEKDNFELKVLVLNKSGLIRNLRILGKQLRQKNTDLERENKLLSAKLDQHQANLKNKSENLKIDCFDLTNDDTNDVTNRGAALETKVSAEEKCVKCENSNKCGLDNMVTEPKVSDGNKNKNEDRCMSELKQNNLDKNKMLVVQDNEVMATKENQEKVIIEVGSVETGSLITHQDNQKSKSEIQDKNEKLTKELIERTKRNKRLVLLGRQYREKCRNLEEKIKSKDESIQVLTDQVESYLTKENEIPKNYNASNINMLKDNERLKMEIAKKETMITRLKSTEKLLEAKEIKMENQNEEIAALKEKVDQKESDEAEYAESFEIHLENIKKAYDKKLNNMKRSVEEKTITENELKEKEIKIENQNSEIAALKEKLVQKESDEAEYAESFEIRLENIKKANNEKLINMKRSVDKKTFTENELKIQINAITVKNKNLLETVEVLEYDFLKCKDDIKKVEEDKNTLNESLSKEVKSKHKIKETMSKLKTENHQMKIRILKLLEIAKRFKERCKTTEDLFEVEAKEINELNDKVYQLTLKNNYLKEEINRLNLDYSHSCSKQKYDILKIKIKKVKIIGRWFRDKLFNLLIKLESEYYQNSTFQCLQLNYTFRQPININSVGPVTETEHNIEEVPAVNSSVDATEVFNFASPIVVVQPEENTSSVLSILGILLQPQSSNYSGIDKNDVKNIEKINHPSEVKTEINNLKTPNPQMATETSVDIRNSKNKHCISSSEFDVSLSSSDISLSEDEGEIYNDPINIEDKSNPTKQEHDTNVEIGQKRKFEESNYTGKRKKVMSNANDSGFVDSHGYKKSGT